MKTFPFLVTRPVLAKRSSGSPPALPGELCDASGEIVQLVAGKYRVERVLGRGGVGIVVAATHVQLGQKVAIKMLLPKAMQQADALRRFEREARAAAAIGGGDHVVRVYDVGVLDSGAPYMVMEYLEGRDLSDTLEERGALPVDEAVDFILQVCEALAEAHGEGIIHRDLKPANVFLARTPDGGTKVKVLDFGMSKVLSSRIPTKPLTDAFLIMGSPGWMSPEQMRSTRDVDQRSDLWATGAILYNMLTGRPPFVVETVAHLWAATLAATPEHPTGVRPEVPEGLGAVVMKCLEREPDVRFQTVVELARALAPFAPSRAQELVGRIERIASGVASLEPVPSSRVPTPRPPVRTPRELVEGPTRIEIPIPRRRLAGRAGAVWFALPLAVLAGASAALAPSWSRASVERGVHDAGARVGVPTLSTGELAESALPGTVPRAPTPSPAAACPVEAARPAPIPARVLPAATRARAADPLHPEFGDRK
jgi:eukaryotic-like serine/threonine-protein kinase